MKLQDYIAKLKNNPAFQHAYEELGPEMEEERQLLEKRIIWLAQLAELLGSPKANNLTDRHKYILQRHYGFYDGPRLTLKEISQCLRITRERVRNQMRAALDILGHSHLTYPRF